MSRVIQTQDIGEAGQATRNGVMNYLTARGRPCVAHRPRYCKICLTTSIWSITLMIFSAPLHCGQVSGSASDIFCISQAQPLRFFDDAPLDLMMPTPGCALLPIYANFYRNVNRETKKPGACSAGIIINKEMKGRRRIMFVILFNCQPAKLTSLYCRACSSR